MIKLLARLAEVQVLSDNLDAATVTYSDLLLLQRELGDIGGEAKTLALLGSLADRSGRATDAVEYYDQAIELAGDSGDARLAAAVLRELAAVEEASGRESEAIKTYGLAIEYARKLDDDARIAQLLGDLASLLRKLEDFEASNAVFTDLLDVQMAAEDLVGQAQTLGWIGANEQSMGDVEEALDRYEAAVTLAEAADDMRLAAAVLRESRSFMSSREN